MSRFADHIRYVAGVVGTTRAGSATAVGPKLADMVKAEVNHSIRRIWTGWDWSRFGMRDHLGRVWPTYSTGTITMTRGRTAVAGAGTAWTKAYQHGLLEVAPTGGTTLRIRVREVSAAGTLTLMGPWGFPTEAGLTYTLYQDTYPLPHDCLSVEDGSVNLHDLAEPLTWIDRRELNYLLGGSTTFGSGEPQRYIDDEVIEHPLWDQDDDAGAPGTVAATANAAGLVGTGTSWDSALLQMDVAGDVLVGWPIRVNTTDAQGLAADNMVFSVGGALALTLFDPFRGPTVSGRPYVVGPPGSPVIQLWPPPTATSGLALRYRRKHIQLVNDDDVCLIPSQWDHVVDELAASRALLQMKQDEAVLEQARSHFARFKEALMDMKAWDHPHRKARRRMEDIGAPWHYLGGVTYLPEFAGPRYWRGT